MSRSVATGSSQFVRRARRRLIAFGWIPAVACLAACGGGLAPLLNVEGAPVVTASGQPASREVVRNAILRALAMRGWQLEREAPDGIVATVVSGGHSATVHIQYEERAYSIDYVDSSPGLKFNGSRIHRRYNEWIERLNRTIRMNLMGPPEGVQVIVAPAAPGPVPPYPPSSEAAPSTEPSPPRATTPDEETPPAPLPPPTNPPPPPRK
jgi:hypothetical protein